ncbi:unnamed protein product [Citrullus colocynthis]|uniref:Uncharacterized protein n=1 Tax=Citrullus colocynthis TaxID=252529 RepID=A0ABP0YEB3_9ROSI
MGLEIHRETERERLPSTEVSDDSTKWVCKFTEKQRERVVGGSHTEFNQMGLRFYRFIALPPFCYCPNACRSSSYRLSYAPVTLLPFNFPPLIFLLLTFSPSSSYRLIARQSSS